METRSPITQAEAYTKQAICEESCLYTESIASTEEYINEDHSRCGLSTQSNASTEEDVNEECASTEKCINEEQSRTNFSTHSDASTEEGANDQHSRSLEREASVISNISEPELEPDVPDRDDLDEDSEWEPIVSSNLQRQETDENWPAWTDRGPPGRLLPVSRPPGTFFSHNSAQQPESGLTTYMAPHLSGDDAMHMYTAAPIVPSIVAVCAWPLVDHRLHVDVGCKRSSHRRRAKRETPLDIAKRQQAEDADVKFCPWCGGSRRPSYKFCMHCGEAYNAR